MVEWLEYPTPLRGGPGSKPARVKLESIYSMDAVREPHKQLGAEAYCYVMIYTPMTCLTLKETVKSPMVGRKKQEFKKSFVEEVDAKWKKTPAR